MPPFRLLLALVLLAIPAALHSAEKSAPSEGASLVKDGQPQAEIIIAENPQRSARLAAHELQTYVQKISGAKLPIVTRPSGTMPVKLYVGRSADTDRLKITADGLKDGAYRIATGPDWMC